MRLSSRIPEMNARSQRLLRTSMSLGTVFLLCLLYVTVPVVVRLTSGTPSYAVGVGFRKILAKKENIRRQETGIRDRYGDGAAL